jgi:Undecaprenyl-phosphate galactose phosphotransferase WbaP
VIVHPVAELERIFRATTLTVLGLATVSFFAREVEAYSRLILLGAWILIVAFVWLGRVAARHCLGNCGWWCENAVILGAGSLGRQVAETLRRSPGTGLRPVAILDDNLGELMLARGAAAMTGPLAAADLLAEDAGVRYAIIALPDRGNQELAAVMERYASRFHHVLIIPGLCGIPSLGVDARDLGGILGVKVSHRLLQRTPQTVKRAVDLMAAGLLCLLLLPVFAGIAALIRLSSPGPVLFGHRRLGRHGREFLAWKFRTMVSHSDEVLRSYLEANPDRLSEWSVNRKLKQDPRVTWLGEVLRRTSLDELPQLWNVIRGEMSLVGPRPIVEAETDRYGPRYSLYRKVRPGLTGLWQVSGRNNTTYAERVEFDEYYVRNWSVWLDLYILGRTIKVVVTGEGAY